MLNLQLLTDRIFTSPADVNLDGQFDSSDLVTLFQAGTYDKDVDAAWSEGDLNGDGRFDSADLIVAFASGDFIKE